MDSKRKTTHEEIARKLFQESGYLEKELKSQIERALDPDYWRTLNTDLSLLKENPPSYVEGRDVPQEEWNEHLRKLAHEGYFLIDSILAESSLRRMGQCVDVLRKEGWPPVFAFIYDEFWLSARIPSLVKILSSALDSGYLQTSHIWLFRVDPREAGRGWPPHSDGTRAGKRITIWIPITDATLDNGCMYLIPKNLLSDSIAEHFQNGENLTFHETSTLLQSSRALPARSGSILCWDYQIIHWGSICSEAGSPRISIGMAFVGKDTEPTKSELPLLLGAEFQPVSLRERLHLIGKAILTYQEREPWTTRYLDLARALVVL